jgi:diaminopimelate epimerase
MTGTNCDLFTHNQSRSYLNHLVLPLHALILCIGTSLHIPIVDSRTFVYYLCKHLLRPENITVVTKKNPLTCSLNQMKPVTTRVEKITRKAKYVYRNIQTRSRNHYCRGKAVRIIHFCVCVCGCTGTACVCTHVALLVQHKTRMRHITIGQPLWLHQMFRHYKLYDIRESF